MNQKSKAFTKLQRISSTCNFFSFTVIPCIFDALFN